MQTLPQRFKDWKATDHQTDPPVTLYDISVTDAITLRLIEGNPKGGSITYNGNVYQPAGIARSDVEQSVEGTIGSFELQVSNIDGVAGGYIEQYQLDERRVTITHLPGDTLNPADAITESYTIQAQSYNRERASVTLGFNTLFKRTVPWRRYQRIRCLHDWENRFDLGNGCGYPSDEFMDDTMQMLKNGAVTDAEQKRKFGWYTLNMLKANSADTNGTELSELWLSTISNDTDWAGSSREGPYVYKKLTGDFDVYTRVELVSTRDGGLMGIICQEDGAPQDSWVFLARTRKPGEAIRIVLKSAIDGEQQDDFELADPDPRYLRMERVGDVFTLYHSETDNTNWVELTETTIPMSTEIRIGLAIGGGQGTALAASFPFFRFRSGGPSTCDRTKDGPDGCRVKDNVHRIFLFDGIPRR